MSAQWHRCDKTLLRLVYIHGIGVLVLLGGKGWVCSLASRASLGWILMLMEIDHIVEHHVSTHVNACRFYFGHRGSCPLNLLLSRLVLHSRHSLLAPFIAVRPSKAFLLHLFAMESL